MILSFKQQFIKPIHDGIKIHTFRLDPADRWHAGRTIQGATGVRTKHYKEFFSGLCYSVQLVKIQWLKGAPAVCVWTKDPEEYYYFSDEKIELAAKNDGFKDTEEFFEWFDKDFSGKIIHWTKFKY